MYSQTEHYTAMVVNIQCKYMSFFTSKNQTSNLDKENIEWGIQKRTIQKKVVTYGTYDEEKQNKNTICVGHHYEPSHTNNVDETRALLPTV